MNSNYLESVLNKIKASKLPITVIARETGVDVRWLYQLVNRKMELQAFERLMCVNEFLDQHQESLAKLKNTG